MMVKAPALPALAALFLAAAPLDARPSGENGDVIAVEILPGWREADGSHIAAIKMVLAEGWKTYWRSPGDAGIPPQFDWSGSENVARVTPHFPVPKVFDQEGMRAIGYKDQVVIPLRIDRARQSAPIRLSAEVSLGICLDICIPAFVNFDAMLPAEGASHPDIVAALSDRPMTEREASVGAVTCSIRPIDNGLSLTVSAQMPAYGREEEAAIETADPSVWVAEPDMVRDGGTLHATTRLIKYDDAPIAFDRSGLRMTVFAGGEAVDIQGCTAR
ncbi:MAG: protein-disulfide reductase DsbD domain-containing protein [Pseudomonadota bacterium]